MCLIYESYVHFTKITCTFRKRSFNRFNCLVLKYQSHWSVLFAIIGYDRKVYLMTGFFLKFVCLFVRLGSFWDIKLVKGMFHLASTTVLLTLKTSVPYLLAPSLVSSCVHGMACFLPVRFKNSQKKPGEMGLIAWLALL